MPVKVTGALHLVIMASSGRVSYLKRWVENTMSSSLQCRRFPWARVVLVRDRVDSPPCRPFSIMLAFFSAFFEKTSIFFVFSLKKEFLAFSVTFHDCDPYFQHSELRRINNPKVSQF